MAPVGARRERALLARRRSLPPRQFECVAAYLTPAHEGLTSVSCGEKVFVTGSDSGMLRQWPMPDINEFKKYFDKKPKTE